MGAFELAEPCEFVLEVRSAHAALEELLPAHRRGDLGAPAAREHPIEHHPFAESASGAAHLERGAGREGHEVDPLIAQAADDLGKQRETVGVLDLRATDDIEPAQVLPCDLGIGTDVDDVDSLVGRPEVLDGLRDDSLCDHGLTETDFIGDEEPFDLIVIEPQPAEGVVRGGALEVLETGKGAAGVRFHESRSRCTCHTTSHSSSNPSGTRSAPFGISRRSSTRLATRASASSSRPVARTNGSNKATSIVAHPGFMSGEYLSRPTSASWAKSAS